MVGARKRGEELRQFILEHVADHSHDLAKFVGETFGISRQAVNRHIQQLVEENAIALNGKTRSRHYKLKSLIHWETAYVLDGSLQEDQVWRKDIAPLLGPLPRNQLDIWHYGFTEMLNNAIDHSSGKNVHVQVDKTAIHCEISLYDDGEGIFRKIQRAMGLLDARHAVLELAKGKLTTDPENHSGEGIFFSSRIFDEFVILSGGVYFSHVIDRDTDWIDEADDLGTGTTVFLRLRNNSTTTLKDIFDKFTTGDEYGFTKTVVPVRLAQYGDEMLVSRSQAKRLLGRIEKFQTVILDFTGVDGIGQAFADEIFRVFPGQHPHISLIPVNANDDIERMISRATQLRLAQAGGILGALGGSPKDL